tara:strand:- start:420 stop:890 length:471 start_codon:yes stop_codon:yes gene_type:complete
MTNAIVRNKFLEFLSKFKDEDFKELFNMINKFSNELDALRKSNEGNSNFTDKKIIKNISGKIKKIREIFINMNYTNSEIVDFFKDYFNHWGSERYNIYYNKKINKEIITSENYSDNKDYEFIYRSKFNHGIPSFVIFERILVLYSFNDIFINEYIN